MSGSSETGDLASLLNATQQLPSPPTAKVEEDIEPYALHNTLPPELPVMVQVRKGMVKQAPSALLSSSVLGR